MENSDSAAVAPPAAERSWICRGHTLAPPPGRPAVMGILNCTPDSFSDGGRYVERDRAVERGLSLAAEGAEILDIGGESTRPGADPVDEAEEIRRTAGVVRELAAQTDCLLSIDTRKAPVARAALEAGAHIVNDVSACSADPAMIGLLRESSAGVVLMHMRGTPRTMQTAPEYGDCVGEIRDFLRRRLNALCDAGVDPRRVILDPGIGFGKTLEHNLALLRSVAALESAGRPILIGASRKSFLGVLLGREVGDRLAGSLAVALAAARGGAFALRVHDVKETCDALTAWAMVAGEGERRQTT